MPHFTSSPVEEGGLVVRDANGTLLKDGHSVVIVKDLKGKGAFSALKSEFVKKS